MCRIRSSRGRVIPRDPQIPICDIQTKESSSEQLKTGDWLVVRDFVTSLCLVSQEEKSISWKCKILTYFVDASEGEIPTLSDFAIFGAVDHEWCISSSCELSLVSVVDSERYSLTSEPASR